MKNILSLKLITILTLLITAVSSCHNRTIKGSGHISSETRPVSGFNEIEANAALKVIYTEGNEYKIEVVADDNLIKYITTEVHGDELQIGIQERKSFKKVTKMEIHVTSPSIREIEINGASTFEALNTLHGNDLSIKLSGASQARLEAQLTSLKTDLSGASTLNVTGTATTAQWNASGASGCHAGGMSTETSSVNFSGASSGSVWAQTSLNAILSGASSLDYYGNPTVNVNTSGSSTIHKK